MIRFALYDYIPQRFLNRATFEEIDLHRRILDFKDAKPYATRWAAKEIGYALSAMDLSDTYIVCIPACCKRTHDRRYKEFTKMVCEWCGAKNGFDFIHVFGHRQKAHIDHVYELADNADEFIHVDSQLKGKNIIVIDDIITTGKTATAFIDRMVSAGANVKMAFFLAKTKYFKRHND